MNDSRVVRPSPNQTGWEVASAPHHGSTFSVHPTQAEAISAARSQIAASGGDVRVCGRDGLVRHSLRVAAPSSRLPIPGPAPTPNPAPARAPAGHEVPESFDSASVLDDIATLGDSLRANARGERLDDDGDGVDDGEAIATRVLGPDDGSATSLFFRGTGAFVTIVLGIVLPAFAAHLGIRIRGAEALGGTYWTVFAATIAWSGGIAIAVFAFRVRPAGWTAGSGAVAVGGGFALSSMVASIVGGATMLVPANLASPDLYRLFIQTPKTRQAMLAWLLVAVAALIWFVLLAGYASYGLIGLILGALVGVAIGLQAAHRVKTLLAREGSTP